METIYKREGPEFKTTKFGDIYNASINASVRHPTSVRQRRKRSIHDLIKQKEEKWLPAPKLNVYAGVNLPKL
jgi:hypothetical protein